MCAIPILLLLRLALSAASAALPQSSEGEWWSGCPHHLLDVEEDGQAFRLSEGALRYLSEQASPLYVVPVLGVYRGGKSFLLNRCMGLKAPYTNGFGVGHSQETHTRGIFLCAEPVDGLGTVVWMDTEGLFSSEFARSAYGPKIFSLALLFSSAVLLNSVKVLNNEFFSFFGEQQQVARVLRQGLLEEGLPEASLLPGNLSVFWVLQQPISWEDSSGLSSQLESFLDAPGDASREHIRRDFRHHLQIVPSASHDVRLWGSLDRASDEELSSEFHEAVARLRSEVFAVLATARPLQAASAAQQLRMYAQLVQTEQFSGRLAREALEEGELSARCGGYETELVERAGALPAKGLPALLSVLRAEASAAGGEAVQRFHFSKAWQGRLGECLDGKEAELLKRGDEALFAVWQEQARELAEGTGCFFLDGLVALREEQLEEYGRAEGAEDKQRTLRFAMALQRARLVECLKVKHLLGPFVPWLAWPLIAFYIRAGVVSGLTQFAVHAGTVVGLHTILKAFKQLPFYLDTDYPLLRARPGLLDATMQLLPWMPWAKLGTGFGALGAAWCGYKVLRAIIESWRPAGNVVGGITALELKVNLLMERSRCGMEQSLLAALNEATVHALHRDDEVAAATSLMRALCVFRSHNVMDPHFAGALDNKLRQRVRRFLEQESQNTRKRPWEVKQSLQRLDVMAYAIKGEYAICAEMILEILEAGKPADGGGERPSLYSGLHNRAKTYLASTTSAG